MNRATARAAPAKTAVRALCLGNDLLADDAFGIDVAHRLRQMDLPGLDVVDTIEAGLALLDHLSGADRVIVVDTILTGDVAPGTLLEIREGDVARVPGGSPHYMGLFEALELGRALGIFMPDDVTILAVEGADCFTLGGGMDVRVSDAMGAVVGRVEELVAPGD